jgi:hypothetical protein
MQLVMHCQIAQGTEAGSGRQRRTSQDYRGILECQSAAYRAQKKRVLVTNYRTLYKIFIPGLKKVDQKPFQRDRWSPYRPVERSAP